MEPFGYVTFDPNTGELTGSFLQVPPPEHEACLLAVGDEIRLNWVAYRANAARDGVELAPVLPPVAHVPTSVTRRQARQALLLADLLDIIPGKIAAIPDEMQRGMAQIEWEDSQVFERHRPLVMSIGAALGLSSEAIDQLFITAAAL